VQTGAALWSADLTAGFDRGGNVSGGGLALSGGTLFATTGYGELVALDASNGAIRWRQRLGAGAGTPTVSGNTVYVVSRDNRAWAVSTDVGRVRWELPSAPARALLTGGAAPAVSGGTVIFPFGTGEIVAAQAGSGVRSWATAVAGGRLGAAYSNVNDITSDPVVVGGTVYAGNQSGRVVALNASTGTRLWTANEGSYSPVLAVGGSLFFVSDRNELIRLDASNGERIWGVELPLYVRERERRRRAVFTHYGPILAGGRLVMASGDGQIRMFDPASGQLVQSVGLRGGAASHPIVVNNTLMVVNGNGQLIAYR
jgi:outer membrane protein assembly factor BamB